MSEAKDEFALIQKLKGEFKSSMDEIIKLHLDSDPEADPQQIKEDFLLEKMATILVGSIILGRQVRELEKKLNEIDKNT